MPVYVSRGLPEIVCASVRLKGVARDSLCQCTFQGVARDSLCQCTFQGGCQR